MNASSADDGAIRAEKEAAFNSHALAVHKHRVEQAAIKIFAAMQANPNWNGSNRAQREAVSMAEELIAAIDHAFTPQFPNVSSAGSEVKT